MKFIMKIILLFLLFNVYVHTEPIKNRAVNLALETVLEFDKKDRASDIKFIDDVQTFLNKVKNVLNKKVIDKIPSFRRVLIPIPLSFTEFLENIVAILKSYDDYELKKIIKLVQNEVQGYNYKGCKFYELLEQRDIKDMLSKKLEELKDAPLPDLRRRMDEVITELHDRKLSKENQEIVDYINSLYKPEKPRKLLDVLNNLQVYQTNTKRSFSDLTRIVRHGLRNVIFNHYSLLEPDVRRGLKIRLEYLARNAMKQVIDHRIYDIKDNSKTTPSIYIPIVTTVSSTHSTLATHSVVYDVRQKTTRLSSVENSGEYVHVYPKDNKHQPSRVPKKELLRTVWEEQWTTEKKKKDTEENINMSIASEDANEKDDNDNDDSKVEATTTKTTTQRIKKKRARKLDLTSRKTDKSSVATTKYKKHRKKHHKTTTSTTTEKITTTSTKKTKRRKKKKVHKKYVEDTTTTALTETTKKEHHKQHHKVENIISNLPVLEERINKIDYNKTMQNKRLKWKKDHDSRYRSYGTTTTLAPRYILSNEVKYSDNEIPKPHKKKLRHIVLGMPMAEDHYSSKETTKRKIWTYTRDKKLLQKKLERNIYNEHMKQEKDSSQSRNPKKKEKPTSVTMKTPTGKPMHTLEYEPFDDEPRRRPDARPGRFRVTSGEDEISVKTKSSCEDAVEDSTANNVRFVVSDEGLTIESFEDRARKLFVGRRAQNVTDATNAKDSDSVLKRIDIIEKELQDVKHIILDKEAKKSSDNETDMSETAEESEITSYEYENSTEANTTECSNSTKSVIKLSTVTMSTKSMLRKGFEEVNTSALKGKTNPTVKNDNKVKTTTSSPNKTETTTKSTVSNTLTTKYDKLIFRTGGVTNSTNKMLEEKSVEKTTTTTKVANETPSINNLIENFISQEQSTKATKKKLFRLKNSTTSITTTETPTTFQIKNETTILTSPIVELTTIVVNTTTNRLNASNIMRMSNVSNNNENIEAILKKRLDFYYEDNLMKANKNNYDDLLLDDLREDGAQ